MTDTYVSYAPGSWTLVARAGTYLLVETAPSDQAVSHLWTLLDDGDLGRVTDLLAADLPDAGFCLVRVDENGVLLAQQGLNVLLDGRPVGAGGAPRPVAVPEVGGMIMAAGATAAGQAQLPIEAGVVGAGALLVVQVPAETPAGEEPEAAVAPATEPTPEPIDDLPVKVPEDLSEPLELPDDEPVPTANLWDDVPPLDQSVTDDLAVGAPVVPAPVAAPGPVAAASLAEAPPPVVPPVPAGTVPAPEASVTGTTVLAGYCLNGHISGAYAPRCRVCDDPMPQQSPRTVPRPSLGVLILENGDTYDLESGAVLGRAPRVPPEATETPLLVSLAAYGRDISRQHAEVVVHGWNVFVRDLGSANGTRVREPDGQVVTLEPYVAVVLAPDSVLEIAEVTTVRFRTA